MPQLTFAQLYDMPQATNIDTKDESPNNPGTRPYLSQFFLRDK